jgi:hypothetical protein
MNLREIEKTVREMDSQLAPTEGGFKTAVLLLALLEKGDDIDALTEFTKLPRDFVQARVERLRSNGVIVENGMLNVDWWDEQHGWIEFWMHVSVAEGLIETVPDQEEATFIAPSNEWPDVIGDLADGDNDGREE